MTTEEIVTAIIGDVCELPDYTSPDDQPDLLQCRVHELKSILQRHLSARPEAPRLGYVQVELSKINHLTTRLKELAEAGSRDAKSLAADAALLIEASRG